MTNPTPDPWVFDDDQCQCGHAGSDHDDDDLQCTKCRCVMFIPDEKDLLS